MKETKEKPVTISRPDMDEGICPVSSRSRVELIDHRLDRKECWLKHGESMAVTTDDFYQSSSITSFPLDGYHSAMIQLERETREWE